jgi:ribosomal protein L7/L12
MINVGAPAYASPMMIEEMIKNRKPRICDLVLEEVGPNKIEVIKLLRIPQSAFIGDYATKCSLTPQLTLCEAKKLVDKPLSVIYENISYYDAKEIKEKFTKLGAIVHIVVTSWDYDIKTCP